MMKDKVMNILLIGLLLFCLMGVAYASDLNEAQLMGEDNFGNLNGDDSLSLSDSDIMDDSIDDVNLNQENNVLDESIYDDVNLNQESSVLGESLSDDGWIGEEDSHVIYVGRNITENGEGTYENPFSTLSQASANTSGEDKVIVNLFNGTYDLGSVLKFNTSNLIIQGFEGEAIIKATDASASKAIQLVSPSADFTMRNIVFDASSHPDVNAYIGPFFYPFSGNAISGTYINCSFLGFKNNRITGAQEYNATYINCLFEGFNGYLFAGELKERKKFVYFKNCIFLDKDVNSLAETTYTNKNITFDGAWFGQNDIPEYVFSGYQLSPSGGSSSGVHVAKITRYAIFSVYENYLGNNRYEIIGKLTWNDTDDIVGDSFNPMTVDLSSSTGEIQNNAVLTNGSFKAIYTGSSSAHSVTAQLGYEKITLNFNNINMNLNSPSVYYGDDENITADFSQPVNGILRVVVGNKTYNADVNGVNSFTYKIADDLIEGRYEVNVYFDDLTNHVHAYGTTELIVSKVTDFIFNSIVSSLVNVGCNTTIIVELPEDATGTVTVVLGDSNFTKDASKSTEIIVNGFAEGDNEIRVLYSGDNKYVPQSKVEVITAEKVEITMDNATLSAGVPQGTNIPVFGIVLPSDATGNLTVNINGKDYTQKLVKGTATITINGLAPGRYDAVITYSGDGKYNKATSNASVSVPKTAVTAKDFSMLYTSGSKYTVRVTLDGKPVSGKTVTFIVNGKKSTATTDNNGYASVKINLPPKAKAYTVSATCFGVKKTNKVTVKSIVAAKNMNVKKSAKTVKIKVTLKKVNNKYLKGKKVSLKLNGKTYNAKTNKKGVATFTVKKNDIKKLKVGKKYTYKVTYGKDVVSKKITVKK